LEANEKLLGVVLAVYLVLDVLLTPLGFETRPVSNVTTIGLASLVLLFVGLVAVIVSLVLLFVRPRSAPKLAILGVVLYLPGFFADRAGVFSSLQASGTIFALEIIQFLVTLSAVFLAARIVSKK
jgi:hypothetical protein